MTISMLMRARHIGGNTSLADNTQAKLLQLGLLKSEVLGLRDSDNADDEVKARIDDVVRKLDRLETRSGSSFRAEAAALPGMVELLLKLLQKSDC